MTESSGETRSYLLRRSLFHISLQSPRVLLTGLAILLVLGLAACGGSAPPQVISTPDTPPATAIASETEPVQVVPSPESSAGPSLVRLEFAQGTKAVYLVNEQLARVNLPSDAVGTTDAVSGAILLGADN